MSKVEKLEELRANVVDQHPQEEDEVLDEETTRKLRNLALDDAFFNSDKITSDQKKNQNKKGEKKKNKRGEDFLDYAKNKGIDVKIQYEDNSYNRNKERDGNNFNFNKNNEGGSQEQRSFYQKGGEKKFIPGARNFNNNFNSNFTQEENKTSDEMVNNFQEQRGYKNYQKNENNHQSNFNRKDRDNNFNVNIPDEIQNSENPQNSQNYMNSYSHQNQEAHLPYQNQNQGRQNYGNKNFYQKRNYNNNYNNTNHQNSHNFNNNYQKNNYSHNQNQMYQKNQVGDRNNMNYSNTNANFNQQLNSNKFDNHGPQSNRQKFNRNPNPNMQNYMMNSGMNMNQNPNLPMYNNVNPQMLSTQMMSPEAIYMYQQQMMETYKQQMMMFNQSNQPIQQYGAEVDGQILPKQNSNSEIPPQQTVLETIEYYLSEDNLNKDYYIRLKLNSDGYLDASEIIRFNKMKTQGVTLQQIEEILINNPSNIIQFIKDSEGTLLLRNKHWESFRDNLTPIEALQQQRVMNRRMQPQATPQMNIAPNMGNYYAMYMQNMQMQGDGSNFMQMQQMNQMNPMQMPNYGMMGYMKTPNMQMQMQGEMEQNFNGGEQN